MPFNRVGGHRSLTIWMGMAVALLAVVLTAVVVWDRNFRHESSTNPGMSCPTVVSAERRAPLTAFRVHRVALIGDSIMLQASCSVAESLADVGIETGRYAVSGSGLLTGPVDWISQTRQILNAQHPNVVVAIFVGNYLGVPFRAAGGQPVANDSPAFFSAWQQRAEELSTEVHSAGAQMYWVSPPPISVPPLSHAQRLFAGYQSIRGDHVLGSGATLAGPSGSPVMTKMTCGHVKVIRTIDRVHLSEDGSRLYGQQIAHDLTAQLGVLTTPKPC
jgi:hypothetical protein